MSMDITLSAGVRQNLLSLQNISQQMTTTQNRLATGKKVNSALDNPTNFFTASALTARSGELTSLLDAMKNGINTLQAASNGLTSITNLIQSMQATVTQARQDASWQSSSYSYNEGRTAVAGENLTFSAGAVGATPVTVGLNTSSMTSGATLPVLLADNGKQFTVSDGTNTTADITLATGDTAALIAGKITTAAATAHVNVTATVVNGQIQLSNANGATIAVANGTTTGGATLLNFGTIAYAAKTVDQIASDVNANASLTGKVKASNNAGQLQLTNLSTAALTVIGASATAITGGTGAANTQTIGANTVRQNLVTQFNQLRDQLDKTAADSSFNGVNLLQGDALKLYFNEHSTSFLTIQSTNANGINNQVLSINSATNAQFQDNSQLDTTLSGLQSAQTTVASQASAFGSNLAIVQNRQDFTNNMVNTLGNGAADLTLADTNLEGANMLALQTRQQLSITALSMASQANGAVMRLFG
jgi:flagellin